MLSVFQRGLCRILKNVLYIGEALADRYKRAMCYRRQDLDFHRNRGSRFCASTALGGFWTCGKEPSLLVINEVGHRIGIELNGGNKRFG